MLQHIDRDISKTNHIGMPFCLNYSVLLSFSHTLLLFSSFFCICIQYTYIYLIWLYVSDMHESLRLCLWFQIGIWSKKQRANTWNEIRCHNNAKIRGQRVPDTTSLKLVMEMNNAKTYNSHKHPDFDLFGLDKCSEINITFIWQIQL